MRWLILYARSRSMPTTLAVIVCCTLAAWGLGRTTDDPGIRGTLALLAVLAGVAAVAPGLAGADVDLDRTAAFAWPPRRFAHTVLAAAAVLGIVAAAALTSAGWLARDVAGLAGLLALGAATLGAARAWLPGIAWTVPSLGFSPPLGAPPTDPTVKVVLTWLAQPAASTPALITAITLGTTGTLMYALRGPRR